MKEQDEIKELFKNSLENLEVKPPEIVKIKIDQEISQIESRGKVKWIYFAGISTLIFILALFLLNQEDSNYSTKNLARKESSFDKQNSKVDQSVGMVNPTKKNRNSMDGQKKQKSKVNKQKQSLLDEKVSSEIKNNSQNIRNSILPLKKSSNNFENTKKEKKGNSIRNNQKRKRKVSKSNPIQTKETENSNKLIKDVENINNDNLAENSTKNTALANKCIDSNSISAIDTIRNMMKDSSDDMTKMMVEPNTKRQWLLSFKTGSSIGINQFKAPASFTLNEKSGLFLQTEFAYYLNSKMAISSGLNYVQNKEVFNINETILVDSVIQSYNYTYIIDSMQNIIDSIAIPVYGSDSMNINSSNNYQVFAVGLPILFQYSFELNPKLFLDLSTGAIINMQGSKVISETASSATRNIHQFGMKVCLRTELRYQFSNFGVSLNSNFGYDLKPIQTWENSERRRSYLNLGIGVHYLIK